MKNSKFQLSAAFLIFLSFASQAQSPADTVYYNREFGFGTNIILSNVFNSSGSPLDFMYRWKSGNGFGRLGTHISFIDDRFSYDNLNSERSNRAFELGINAGKEWREQITSRWLLNYGADLNLSYVANSHRFENHTPGLNGGVTNGNLTRGKKFGPGVRPFIGVMFQINKRLVLGTEASFLARALAYVEKREDYTVDNGVKRNNFPDDNSKLSGWNFQVNTLPASNIFIYYRF